MTTLEIVLVVVTALAALLRILAGARLGRRGSGVLALVLLVVLLVQVVAGARWPMWPAYLGALLIILWSLFRAARPAPAGRPRRGGGVVGLIAVVLALVSAGVASLFPAEPLPAPDGPYRIGVRDFTVTDPYRTEPFGPHPGGPRILELVVWYPAADGHGRAPIWGDPKLVVGALSHALRLPRFVLAYLERARGHAHPAAPVEIKGAPFPVVLFNHGYAEGFPAQNTALCEDLASHGYVVISIGHPYEGLAVAQGQAAPALGDQRQIGALSQEVAARMKPITALMKAPADKTDPRLFASTIANAPVVDRSLDLWVKDNQFVLGLLPAWQAGGGPDLAGALDLGQVAIAGMSFGGATAVQACALDSRCKAAVNLDGFQFGSLGGAPLSKPTLFFANGSSRDDNMAVFQASRGGGRYVIIAGSTHLDYSDLALISPLFRLTGALGPIPGRRMTAIVAAETLNFLDDALKGQNAPPPAFKEATITQRNQG